MLAPASAQEVIWSDSMDHPDDNSTWVTHFGDGAIVPSLEAKVGYMRFKVNAEGASHNVWWTIMISEIQPNKELGPLPEGYKLWMEAEVRASHPFKRINMRLKSQRTVDHHADLMEFDLGSGLDWQTLRFYPPGLDYQPGDRLSCHLAMIDWGLEQFHLDVRNVKIYVAGPDQLSLSANALPYHPEPNPASSYQHKITVEEDGMVDLVYPDENLFGWGDGNQRLLGVSHDLVSLLKWDLSEIDAGTVDDWGLLKMEVHSSIQVPEPSDEYCRIRVMEIIGGIEDWQAKSLTYRDLANGSQQWEVFSQQMMIDMFVPVGTDKTLNIPVSPPVLQRLLDGTTKGLAIFPLGTIQCLFYSKQNNEKAAKLYYNLKKP